MPTSLVKLCLSIVGLFFYGHLFRVVANVEKNCWKPPEGWRGGRGGREDDREGVLGVGVDL